MPWPTGPNGNGPTLELKNPQSDNSLAQNWAASSVNGGTPGSDNTVFTAIDKNLEYIPDVFSLEQNYPNPFNPKTIIEYSVPFLGGARDGLALVQLNVYDLLGQKIRTLVNKRQPAGKYSITFNAVGLASGIYIYRINAGEYVNSKKMLLVR